MSIETNPNHRSGDGARLQDERINTQIAQDVAVGEAVRADVATAAANQYAAGYAAKSVEAADARAARDAAIVSGGIARNQAQNASFGLKMLGGVVAVVVALGALWYANRPVPGTSDAGAVRRPVSAAAPASSAAAAPAVTTVPVPLPAATAAPANRQPAYVPAPAAPVVGSGGGGAPAAPVVPAAPQSGADGPALQGYVQPSGNSGTAATTDANSNTASRTGN